MCVRSAAPSKIVLQQQETGNAEERLIHVRHHDLVVMARARKSNGLPPDIIGNCCCCSAVVRSGAVKAAAKPHRHRDGVLARDRGGGACTRRRHAVPDARAPRGVRQRREAQRSAGGARRSRGADSPGTACAPTCGSSRRQLDRGSASAAEDCGADLIVMGARSARVRDIGVCARSFIAHTDPPVLMMH